MPRPYDPDLRAAFIAACENGMSTAAATKVFGPSRSTAVRRKKEYRETGRVEALPMGGDRRSGPAEEAAGTIFPWIEEQPDMTIEEIRERLLEEIKRSPS